MIKIALKKILGKRITFLFYQLKRRCFNFGYYFYLFKRLLKPRLFRSEKIKNTISMFEFSVPIVKWIEDGAKELIFKHALDKNSVIMEIGGYRGIWSLEMVRRYDPHMYIYEPIAEYCEEMREVFKENKKVHVFSSAVGAETKTIEISHSGVQSSTLTSCDAAVSFEKISMVDIKEVLENQGTDMIDLININIEGGEYELLQRIIDLDKTKMFRNIQVQFHEWYPSRKSSHALRAQLRQALSKTHIATFDYPFVYENWSLKT